jgi:hypothetical protein
MSFAMSYGMSFGVLIRGACYGKQCQGTIPEAFFDYKYIYFFLNRGRRYNAINFPFLP